MVDLNSERPAKTSWNLGGLSSVARCYSLRRHSGCHIYLEAVV